MDFKTSLLCYDTQFVRTVKYDTQFVRTVKSLGWKANDLLSLQWVLRTNSTTSKSFEKFGTSNTSSCRGNILAGVGSVLRAVNLFMMLYFHGQVISVRTKVAVSYRVGQSWLDRVCDNIRTISKFRRYWCRCWGHVLCACNYNQSWNLSTTWSIWNQRRSYRKPIRVHWKSMKLET